MNWQIGTVVNLFDETPRTKSVILELPDWDGHLPGQHVDVRLTAEDGYQAQRSYSIASAPVGQQIELTVERLEDGEVSSYLTDVLQTGDQLELRGPIGGYFSWNTEMGGPLLLVAGGSGIAPLMAMIRYRAATGNTVPTRLLYSSRTYEEVIYRDELARRAQIDAGLEIFQTLTRGQPAGWTGFGRRINPEMLSEVAWAPEERPLAYVCGPTGLVESVSNMLVNLGHDPARVRTERFGPTGG